MAIVLPPDTGGTNTTTNYIDVYMPSGVIRVNPEQIGEDNRLDEALDSAKFSFITKDINKDIPPFTKAILNDNGVESCYFISSDMDVIVEMQGYYYHHAQLIEAIKICETWDIGTKAFSVIPNRSGYNTGYNRLSILNQLVKANYGYDITLDFSASNLNAVRDYQYGAGTTYFDILIDICKHNNCLPYVSSVDMQTKVVIIKLLKFDDIKNQSVSNFSYWIKITKTQSVDEYCSDVVTEMNAVVDRDTYTTCIITPRSSDDFISKDNSLLKLPTNCESVKYIYGWFPGYKGPTCKLSSSVFNFSSATLYDKDIKSMSANLKSFINSYVSSSITKNLLNQWISHMEDINNKSRGYYDNVFIYWEKDNYLLMTLWNASDYSNQSGWVNIGLLNSEDWSLLNTNDQPAYIYFNSDSNTIDGFNNYKDNENLPKRLLFGSKGPFLKEFFKLGSETDYKRPLIYEDFDELSTIYSVTSLGSLPYINNYFILNFSGSPSTNILDYKWKVVYVAKSGIKAIESKSITPDNEASWKKTTRSYNNGASTVNYNQLIPAMRKSADMLGLEITSVETLEDKEVGTLTQFGYIISKQSRYNFYKGRKFITSAVYNCCKNYEQIAQAIGIDTQWEATNVPKNGVVTRFVNLGNISISSSLFSTLDNESTTVYLSIYNSGIKDGTLTKACVKRITGNTMYVTCEAVDNYTFDYSKEESNTGGYYKNNPVSYGDSDQCADEYFIRLKYDNGSSNYPMSTYDQLPKGAVSLFTTIHTDTYSVYKDAREKLVFQFKLIRS